VDLGQQAGEVGVHEGGRVPELLGPDGGEAELRESPEGAEVEHVPGGGGQGAIPVWPIPGDMKQPTPVCWVDKLGGKTSIEPLIP